MIKEGLFVLLQVKEGKEAEVEALLKSGINVVQREAGTITWYAFRMGPQTFGIFDTFNDDAGRDAHLVGDLAKAIMEKAEELLDGEPAIEKIEILAAKSKG